MPGQPMELDINWGQDPYGRRGQLQRWYWELESRANELADQLAHAQAAIPHLENENRNKVNDAARDAYAAVEEIVMVLLTIDKGDKVLSKDATVNNKLNTAVNKFEVLSTASTNNMETYGLTAGSSMALGDKSSAFETELQERMDKLNGQIQDIQDQSSRSQGEMSEYQGKNENLRREHDDAVDELNSVGNQVLGFFSNDVKYALEQKVKITRDRLDKNIWGIFTAWDRKEAYYQLCIFTRNASAALAFLKDRVRTVSKQFDEDYEHVTHCLEVENRLASGLLRLRNQIRNPDFSCTRDNSLKVILELLKEDDEVFQRQSFYEDTEVRIKEAIRDRLGEDGVEKILHPPGTNNVLDVY